MEPTLPANEFPLPKNSYAAFDAISIRNLILQRLDEQGIFTDQNYVGSNLAAIVDVISYSFNTLMFYLNKTSTESTFTEAQLYENISRLVKILDYKPIGYQTSTLSFSCQTQGMTPGTYTIPRYSYVTTDLGTSFSFNEDITFTVTSSGLVSIPEINNRKLLYQGTYREFSQYTALGDPNEVVQLNITNALIDHFSLDVYVYESLEDKWYQYTNVSNLYTQTPVSRVFEKNLNSNNIYDITFGDGINGKKLSAGDKVSIFFLQSSGPAGVIGPSSFIGNNTINLYYSQTYKEIQNDLNSNDITLITTENASKIIIQNTVGSTYPREGETTESIRKNAPSVYRSQYRLVTQKDFETYIKTNFSQFLSDVRVFSNWDYINDYLRYFNRINVQPAGFGQILLNQVQYSTACNFNNVYVCAIPRIAKGATLKYLLPSQKELIKTSLADIKCLTSEITFLDPVYKAITFGVKTPEGEVSSSELVNTFLRIVRIPNSKRSGTSIKAEVTKVFLEFFNPLNSVLGGVLNYSRLVNSILQVEGVKEINTVNLATGVVVNNLSLYVYNPTYPELDKEIISSNKPFEPFDFVYFEDLTNVSLKIEVTEN